MPDNAADILISPLGRSPGAVSGVYFALAERGRAVRKVVTVGTSHPAVLNAAEGYLCPIFELQGVDYDAIHLPEAELRNERRSVMPYASMVGLAIENAVKEKGGGQVHVAITGGRSGMGALATLAAQLYGADKLRHLWVPAEIEQNGTVDQLDGLVSPARMCESPLLNPTQWGPDAWDLVDLPFLDLSPLAPDLKKYWRSGHLPDDPKELSGFLQKMGAQTLFQIFPAGMTFGLAEEAVRVAKKYGAAQTAEERDRRQAELLDVLQRAGIVDVADRINVRNILMAQGTSEELVRAITKDRLSFWKFLKEHKDEIDLLISSAGLAINSMTFILASVTFYCQATGVIH
jgi:hypothetical protein